MKKVQFKDLSTKIGKIDIRDFNYDPLSVPHLKFRGTDINCVTKDGYFYFNECTGGSTYSIKVPSSLFELIKSSGSCYKLHPNKQWYVFDIDFGLLDSESDYLWPESFIYLDYNEIEDEERTLREKWFDSFLDDVYLYFNETFMRMRRKMRISRK